MKCPLGPKFSVCLFRSFEKRNPGLVRGCGSRGQAIVDLLLGMAIKYAGLRGKEVRVIGKNRGSLGEEERIQ